MAFYAALFAARTDAYAVRWENTRSARSGWMPAVRGRWRKGIPAAERQYQPLTADVLTAHLSGLAAMLDALAYLKAARAVGAPVALEVSRSGAGAHAWLFFASPIAAALARQIGTGLLRKARCAAG